MNKLKNLIQNYKTNLNNYTKITKQYITHTYRSKWTNFIRS